MDESCQHVSPLAQLPRTTSFFGNAPPLNWDVLIIHGALRGWEQPWKLLLGKSRTGSVEFPSLARPSPRYISRPDAASLFHRALMVGLRHAGRGPDPA